MTRQLVPIHVWQLNHIQESTHALHKNHLYGVLKHRLQSQVAQFASSPVATIREEALDALIGLFLKCESDADAQQALSIVLSDVGHDIIKRIADTFMHHALHRKQSDFLATSAYEAQRVAEVISSVFVAMLPAAGRRCLPSSKRDVNKVLIHVLLTWPESAMASTDALSTVLGTSRAERLNFVQDGSAEKLCNMAGDQSQNEQATLRCLEALCLAARMFHIDGDKDALSSLLCVVATHIGRPGRDLLLRFTSDPKFDPEDLQEVTAKIAAC
eukprot:jgi/Ulvmu1/7302/UM035_0091.1